VPKLDLPVYLIEGRFDHNASSQIAERWFNKLQAPGKQFIWFEHWGHPPYDFEPHQIQRGYGGRFWRRL
jgi:proline iminopeptidase